MEKENLENSFMEMIRCYDNVIYKVCSFYISAEYTLQDLYQDIVYNLWSAYPKFRNESKISTWIYKIALNTCITGLRKSKRKPDKVSLSTLYDSFPATENVFDDLKEMYQLIQQLSAIEKAIILLWLEEKSYQEIAEITGLTKGSVGMKIQRTKEKLKKMSNY